MDYVDYISVFYKKGRIRKHILPKMEYYATSMFMWNYNPKHFTKYNLKKFKDLISINEKRKKGDGIMLTY